MVIEYYEPNSVSVDTLLTEALASGAYDKNAGWIHKKLINLSGKYGLEGNSYDVTKLSKEKAYASLESHLKGGPVIVSVHYKFDPKSTIPHLVVIDGVDKDTLYYNDPAAKSGEKQISKALFLKAWKSKFIVIRPVVIKNKTT
jgi:predicted double-glycine peptidase